MMQKFDAYQITFQYFGHLLQVAPGLDLLRQTRGLLSDMADCGIFEGGRISPVILQYPVSPAVVLEIAASHLRLFSGPCPAAPPWESVWLERERLLFGIKAGEVAALYAEWGVEIINRPHEPPDHLGLELSFLSHLISMRNLDNGGLAMKTTADFLEQHILKFAGKVLVAAKNDECEFYPEHLELMSAALLNLRNDLQGQF